MKYSQKDIQRFFEGKLSKADAKSIMEWISSDEGETEMGSMITNAWNEEVGTRENSAGTRKNNVLSPRGFEDGRHSHAKKTQPKQRHHKLWIGIAATATLIFSIGYGFFKLTDSQPETPIAQIEELPPFVKTTLPGQRKLVVLPDGSRVTLNADSKIAYGRDFKNDRTIVLEGEGFFEVVKDASHPFAVISHGLTTTALGTSFNVKAYGKESPIKVTLATGKVRVEDRSPTTPDILMDPGEGIQFDPKTSNIQKTKVDLKGALSWQDGILHFEKVPFNDILTELERWYGVKFDAPAKTSLPTYRCSGTFGPNEYLSNVLAALSYSVDFTYEINDKNVMLDFNKKKPMKHRKKPA